MKIGLCLIVKNEAHIIRESLSCTLPLIDTFSIVDTGSTDNTIQVIKDFYKEKGIEGVVHERPWKNFGHNRTESLQLCDGLMDYILVIDADDLMSFPPNGREVLHNILEKEKPNGCMLNIHQGTEMKYMRGQIFKANDGWCYKGVVHEYPTNCKEGCKMINLSTDFWMESRRLGGRNLTGDKMKRDIEALLKGIEEEPDNDRYYFYLGQSYKDDGNNEEAIKYYKKRFEMKRWHEEAWNSAYNVGECYRRMGNMLKFEYWMQKAFEFHKARAEPLYHLVKHYRETRQFYKALHYINIVRQLPYPKQDVLFVEQFPNAGGIEYEASIVEFYIHPEKCLETTLKYMLLREEYQQNCISNLKFSVKPIISTLSPLIIPQVFGEDFRPSAISCFNYPLVNVRFVNYLPPTEGEYKTKDGSPVQTKNLRYNLETGEYIKIEDSTPLFQSSVKGLEDMRVYNFEGKLFYTATNYYEYLDKKVSIVHGEYGKDPIGIESPTNSDCEKNWLNVPGTDEFIYSWSPLRVGKIRGNKLLFFKEIPTPPLFKTFRGSASPLEIDGKLVALVHFCEYSKKRNYYHCFVELEKQTYKPLGISFPFTFRGNGIEYCLSMRIKDSCIIECFVSFMDSNPHKVEINTKNLRWFKFVEEQKSNIVRVPENTQLYWGGDFTNCRPNGPIETFVNKHISKNKLAVFLECDGIFSDEEEKRVLENSIIKYSFTKSLEDLQDFNNTIVCTNSTRFVDKNNILLLPIHDDTFQEGLKNLLSKYTFPNWNERKSVLFWRGNVGGFERPTIRMKIVEKLLENKNTDVKFGFKNERHVDMIPKEHIGERCSIQDHFQYKFLLMIDGTTYPGNIQWVFGSGSVPVLITHPGNNWWFKNLLKPMENYVPIQYDLSDLEEKIEWLIQNDTEAQRIAENAVKFSEVIFTPEYQQKYINNELNRLSLV
jgi:glycosyltransferase involved in cell wall biosynthesis